MVVLRQYRHERVEVLRAQVKYVCQCVPCPYGSYPERSLVGCCFTSRDFVLYTFRATGRPGTSRGLCVEEK